mgnify:CR=1 FL=1
MSIHKEGYLIILGALILLVVINIAVHFLFPGNRWVQNILYWISGILFILILQFFRSPIRDISPLPNVIIAPADGKVVVIEEVEEPEYFKGARRQISIFMSPLNVHVNWYPISGKVNYFKYHAGDYLVAWHPKSSTLNERTTLVIEDNNQREVLVRQIAGAVARRIVCYSKEGQSVTQGQQMGFIKFGSRVDLFIPLDAKVNVKTGQQVTGCKTIMANF